MKRIKILLEKDEKDKGYTIYSHDIVSDSIVLAQGDDLIDAIENFKNTLIDIENAETATNSN